MTPRKRKVRREEKKKTEGRIPAFNADGRDRWKNREVKRFGEKNYEFS